jgi:hypothetical protein
LSAVVLDGAGAVISSVSGFVRRNARGVWARLASGHNPFRYFDGSPEVIRVVVMMYVRYPLSLRSVEDLLAERWIDSAMRPSDFGGTDSARCSLQRSERTGLRICAASPSGVGTWMSVCEDHGKLCYL